LSLFPHRRTPVRCLGLHGWKYISTEHGLSLRKPPGWAIRSGRTPLCRIDR
jgi:hypothetical protein